MSKNQSQMRARLAAISGRTLPFPANIHSQDLCNLFFRDRPQWIVLEMTWSSGVKDCFVHDEKGTLMYVT